MGKVLFVVAPEDFRDEEFLEPYGILKAAGHDIEIASKKAGACSGMLGASVNASLAVSEADKTGWDGVVFVGGGGSAVFFDDESAHGLARSVVARGKVLGAICIAPLTLLKSGLLKGAVATSFPSAEEEMRAGGVNWTGNPVETQPVEQTGAVIITANGPQSATPFGEALALALKG